jgi:hypothetical protein
MSVGVPTEPIVKILDWREAVPGLLLPFLTGMLFPEQPPRCGSGSIA